MDWIIYGHRVEVRRPAKQHSPRWLVADRETGATIGYVHRDNERPREWFYHTDKDATRRPRSHGEPTLRSIVSLLVANHFVSLLVATHFDGTIPEIALEIPPTSPLLRNSMPPELLALLGSVNDCDFCLREPCVCSPRTLQLIEDADDGDEARERKG